MSSGRPTGAWWSVASACLASTLAACASVGPDYVRPSLPEPPHYGTSDPTTADAGGSEPAQRFVAPSGRAPTVTAWWRAFASAPLDDLVERALAGSPTMEAAQATLAQATEAVRAVRGPLAPQVDVSVAASRGSTSAGGTGKPGNASSVGAGASYALDMAGGTKRRVEQAQALLDLQRAQVRATRLSLEGSVVLQAIALASATEQLRAAADIIASDQRNLELVQVSAAAGKSAGLDVLTAEGQLAGDRALAPALQQQASAARHALAVLAGHAPAEPVAARMDFALLGLPADLPVSLPSELVHRRPDILAAEAQLRAASAAIGIATAALYPDIMLDASFSEAAAGSGALFAHPHDVWSLAASLLAPVFDGGTRQAQRAAAIDAYAAQLGNLRQVVLAAFAQVADVLRALEHDAQVLAAQRKALDIAQASLDLTQQSYQVGQASFLQIIEAERQYQQARLGYVRAQTQRYADSAQFFIAMGGDAAEGDATPPASLRR